MVSDAEEGAPGESLVELAERVRELEAMRGEDGGESPHRAVLAYRG